MRILPQAQRDAMYEIYNFCRCVDDIADSSGLAQPARDFGLAEEDFLAVIDGMEMDTVEDIRAPSLATLDLYCDRVASAVGRLSVRVFGLEREDGRLLAHHLGRALQLTNILRDLDEDAGVGRLYLPREWLAEAGISTSDPTPALRSPGLDTVCNRVAARAREHFAEANTIMARSPRQAVKAPRIMGKVYRIILDGMVARGWQAPRPRVRVSRIRIIFILLRYAIA
jgi:presqualene diphosphate synthase